MYNILFSVPVQSHMLILLNVRNKLPLVCLFSCISAFLQACITTTLWRMVSRYCSKLVQFIHTLVYNWTQPSVRCSESINSNTNIGKEAAPGQVINIHKLQVKNPSYGCVMKWNNINILILYQIRCEHCSEQ